MSNDENGDKRAMEQACRTGCPSQQASTVASLRCTDLATDSPAITGRTNNVRQQKGSTWRWPTTARRTSDRCPIHPKVYVLMMVPADNWYRIHPAYGLRDFGDADLVPLSERALGEAWLALREEERDARELRFFGDLLLLIATSGVAQFEAAPTLDVDDRAIRSTAECEWHGDIRAPLSPRLARLLPELNLEGLTVTLDDELVLVLHDGWSGVVVSPSGALGISMLEDLLSA